MMIPNLLKQLLALHVLALSLFAAITITENTEKRLTFTFTLDHFDITSYSKGGKNFSHLSFNDENTKLFDDNKILIPAYSFYVGVPPTGNPVTKLSPVEVTTVQLNHPLAPEEQGRYDPVEYTPIPFQTQWLSSMQKMQFRNIQTGHLFIRPFVYNPKTQSLTILKKGVFSITFPSYRSASVPARAYSGDYYRTVKRMLLNFPVAKNWIIPKKKSRVTPSTYSQRLPNQNMMGFTISDGLAGFNETTTEENGIIKITAAQVAAFFGSSININSFALYGSQRERLDSVVPYPDEIPPGVSSIPLRRVDVNGDGLFNSNDYLLAYVSAICDWYYDTAQNDFEYLFNHYETKRYYWLAIQGSAKTVTRFVQPAGVPAINVSAFENRIRYKQSKELLWRGFNVKPYGGMEWMWIRLTDINRTFTYTYDTSPINTSYPGHFRVVKGSVSGTHLVYFGSTLLADTGSWNRVTDFSDPTLRVTLDGISQEDYFEITCIDARYFQNLDMAGQSNLRIYSANDPNAIARYQLTNIPQGRFVLFRIAADESDISYVADTVLLGATNSFSWVDSTGIGIQYFASMESAFKSEEMTNYIAGVNSGFELKNLTSEPCRANYIIISHQDFFDEALRLAQHKENINSAMVTRVVDVETIFREFSGGNRDPGAIRNFLLHSHHGANWSESPEYVLLFGNGHYDYKGYLTTNVNFIPTIQMKTGSFIKCLEDFFACITPGKTIIDNATSPDLFLGRITCASAIEAKNVVDKIIETEDPLQGDFSEWRNRVLLVSDDDMQGNGPDYIRHYISNERINGIIEKSRPSAEVEKVYLFDYKWNEVFQKPEASRALFNKIDGGVSIVNYFGHGSEEAWADEYILTKELVGNFSNPKKYPLVNSFSCSVGRFDNLGKPCMSGLFVTTANRGGIASISSSRSAFASINEQMAVEMFTVLYERDTTWISNNTYTYDPANWSLGQAYMLTKAPGGVNLKNYVFIGDPSIKFTNITDTIDATITNLDGSPIEGDSCLKALQKIVISGTINKTAYRQTIDPNTGDTVITVIKTPNTQFGSSDSGNIFIGLYNPKQDSVKRKDGGTFTDPTYSMAGSPIFTGETAVKNGTFRQEIQLPLKVPFQQKGVSLKLYAWDTKNYATGFKGNLLFNGTDTTFDLTDKQGPRISVRPVYKDSLWNSQAGFTDKISSSLPLNLEINIWDQSGIDVTGTGPDEGLAVEIPGYKKRHNINRNFSNTEGKFTQGVATYSFNSGEIEPGTYDMAITAQDLLGNISNVTITLVVLKDEEFKLYQTFNYPNPVRMNNSTRFYFHHTHTDTDYHGEATATIRIYTLSGKLLRIIRNARNGHVWDLTDQRGHRLPPNVYLYRITVTMLNAGFTDNEKEIKSPIKKLVILPPS